VLVPQQSVTRPPPGSVFAPVVAPSTNADLAVPPRMSFQRGIISRSCTTRSAAASAA
jgi:hypothetical protein